MENQLLEAMSGVFNYAPLEVVFNSLVAFILGLFIAYTYKKTHQGLSYSQSFVLTIIFVTIIIGFVMMVIGNSLARAFALVGALSIIRFRTVVKDTKDTAYVFMALAVGMGAGTGNYFIAVYATAFMSGVAWILYKFNFWATIELYPSAPRTTVAAISSGFPSLFLPCTPTTVLSSISKSLTVKPSFTSVIFRAFLNRK